MMQTNSSIYPAILVGGHGTRLWPLSRRTYPKQFLRLFGEHSLLQETCLRLADPLFGAPAVIGGFEHRFVIAEQMQEIGVEPERIVIEPEGHNTAPPAAIAALLARAKDEDALVLLLPSDHVINDVPAFTKAVHRGVEAAREGALVAFGIEPDSPHTGYGYIETAQGGGDPLEVVRFVEKPAQWMAEAFLESGRFYWNAGIFLASAKVLIEAFEAHAPDILAACRRALNNGVIDLDFLRLEAAAYAGMESISIDYAIMEKADNIACVPLRVSWSDLGSWPAVWNMADKDDNGNAAHGDVLFHDARNCYGYSQEALVAILGLEDIHVVATRDAILVAPKNKAEEVRGIVDELDRRDRPEAVLHNRVYRPWGWYEGLGQGDRFQVKCIMVKPGGKLSLQSHFHRSEHWVVVKGTLEVTLGDEVRLLSENESAYIPIGERHRLTNPGKLPSFLIEVQSGAYLGEDDIVRHEDVYKREENE